MNVPCPNCSRPVLDTAPGCPACGSLIHVEHPGDIRGVKHRPLKHPSAGILAKATSLLAAITLWR